MTNGKRVLIVDDSPSIRQQLRVCLRGAGYQVDEAVSGEEGLQVAERSPFDLIITDDSSQAATEQLAKPELYRGEIADLVAGRLAGEEMHSGRTALIFAGIGLADAAAAARVFQRATERGVGMVLPV